MTRKSNYMAEANPHYILRHVVLLLSNFYIVYYTNQ